MRKISAFMGAFILLAAIAVAGYGIFTAPADKMTADQKELQSELENNQKAMNEQGGEASPSEQPSLNSEPETVPPSEMPSPIETVSAEPAPSESWPVPEPKEEPKDYRQLAFTAIGDSVMLGAYPALKEVFPNCWIDAVDSRQVWDCLSVVQSLDSEGYLYDTVIIALGTNGTFYKSTGQEIIDYLCQWRTVYWVTGYGESVEWMDSSNAAIHELAEDNANVRIIDWNSVGPLHPEWFREDGIHLLSEGQMGYANFILSSLK